MRIAIDCTHSLVPGGIRTYLEQLIPALVAEGPDDEWVLHFRGRRSAPAIPPLPPAARVRVTRERAPRRVIDRMQNTFGWPPAERWCGALDVFHGMHFHLPPVRRGCRGVLTVHDIGYLRHPELYQDRRLAEYGYRYLLGRSLPRTAAVIASSRATARDLEDLLGVDGRRIWVVHFGCDPRFRPVGAGAQAPVRSKHGLDRPYAIYPIGTIDRRKNLERTLRAFAAAFPRASERPLLLLTGIGAVPSAVARLASELQLDDALRSARVDYPDELVAILSGAEWGMYLSLFEGFGVPPLEMMGCGLPALVSNAASLPEVTEGCALDVDPTDVDAMSAAMRRLHDDASLRADLRARGLARVAGPGADWRRAARQVLAVYRNDRAGFAAAAACETRVAVL